MKKCIIIAVVGLLSASFATHAQTKSFKRGVGFNSMTEQEIELLSPGLSWVYNWGQSVGNYDDFKNNGIDYIPMAWATLNVANARTFLTAHPEIKYILGFNEPNFKSQSNLTPALAAQRWKDIETIADEFNLKIVGPAVNYSPDYDPFQWYDDFFAACPDCRVDYIALHFYMTSASSVMGSVASFVEKYKKPVWLTEFCYDNASNLTQQMNFMVATFDSLETNPNIVRYAWFMDKSSSGYNGLVTGSSLTDLGEVFTYMSSYDNNFYFTTDMQIPATQYIRMNKVNMEKTSDESGHINLSGMGTLSWVDFNVDIPEDGEYNIFFRISAEYGDDSQAYVSVDGNQIASILFDKKGVGVWNTQSCTGTFSKGKQRVRIGFTKGGLRINWWAITKNSNAPSAIETPVVAAHVKIFPNPVENMLYIQPEDNISGISLSDISGKKLFEQWNANAIDMDKYPAGIYLLSIKFAGGETSVRKIIKR